MLTFTTTLSPSKNEPLNKEVTDLTEYAADVERSEFLTKLAAFEASLAANNIAPYTYTSVINDDAIEIVLRDDTPASVGGVMFWERLLGKEVTILDDMETGAKETRVTINLVPRGTEENPYSMDTGFSQKFIVPRRFRNVFATIVTLEWQTPEYIVFGCHALTGSELLIVIYPEHHLHQKGLAYWEEVFSIHGGMHKIEEQR